jgi:hypothetical protein
MVAAAVVGAGIGGALISSSASRSAANSQADAADRASGLSYQQYLQTREDQAPWRAAGTAALSSLTGGLQPGGEFTKSFTMDDFHADPGYQFRIQQGEQAIQRAAAARGAGYSGATLKALARFNSDQASQEYNNSYNRFNNDLTTKFNRYASVAGVGQTATNQTQAAGQVYAGQAGQAIQDAGTARASGYVGTANAVNNAVGQIGNYYPLQSLLPKAPAAATYDPYAANTAAYSTPSGAVSNVLY